MYSLKLDNIYASYRKKEVLRDVSLFVGPREILSLIGPNGAGKSTLLKVAAGFLKAQIGKVWLNNKDISSLFTHQRVRAGLSYFMQGGQVFLNLSVKENIELGTMPLLSDERDESFNAVLDFFPILKRTINKRAGLLSGGERQALALAMILVHKPKIILLDEPSAGLSPKLVREVFLKIREINEMWHIPILIVEQNLRETLEISNRAVVLMNGQISLATKAPKSWLSGEQLESIFMGLKKSHIDALA
jgi:ABC-type branched-subunit amino acid transport system ATPase component